MKDNTMTNKNRTKILLELLSRITRNSTATYKISISTIMPNLLGKLRVLTIKNTTNLTRNEQWNRDHPTVTCPLEDNSIDDFTFPAIDNLKRRWKSRYCRNFHQIFSAPINHDITALLGLTIWPVIPLKKRDMQNSTESYSKIFPSRDLPLNRSRVTYF